RKWTNEGLAKFADILRQDNDNLDKLADNVMVNIINYLDANQGSLFVIEESDEGNDVLVLKACYAYNRKKYLNKTIEPGQGLVGQSYIERDTIYLKDVPSNYVNITSGLGEATPNNVLIVPLQVNEKIYGVVELASFELFTPDHVSFVEKIAENIASTLYAVQSNHRTKELLDESKVLTENMRAQEEEMRQNMEEMAATQEEMQRNRQRLEKSQEKSKFIIECVSEMVVIISQDGQIKEVNAKFINTLKYDQASAEKLHVTDVIVGINMDDPNSFLWNIHQFKIKTSEGKRIDVNIFFGEIYDEDGRPNYVALMSDLTESIKKDQEVDKYKKLLKEAEQTIADLNK
ncbi:MAG: GAF domain-containing protein, partial [Bacteroidota bacterium]